MTTAEFDEFLRLNEEIHEAYETNFDYIYERYGFDDDEAIDAALKDNAEKYVSERHKKNETYAADYFKSRRKML
ncbi:hypothetical protein [Treponema sp.]|uniref:hypothetical protein n=1 Tax=Treponema sp. TaxID=166 RepID=UPI0038910024